MKNALDRFFTDAKKIRSLQDDATHRSYREFVAFFASKAKLTEHEIIIGSYFTYGWMPTMLDLRGDLAEVTAIANRVKEKQKIDEESLMRVAQAINGSVVGASKLLHFINPDQHAIWDSRVYRYIHKEAPYSYRLKSPGAYWDYLKHLDEVASDPRFTAVKTRLERMIGYTVSAKRIGELVMFYNGAP